MSVTKEVFEVQNEFFFRFSCVETFGNSELVSKFGDIFLSRTLVQRTSADIKEHKKTKTNKEPFLRSNPRALIIQLIRSWLGQT